MPARLDRCVEEVLRSGDLKDYPGRTKEESAYAICQASTANKAYRGEITSDLVKAAQTSKYSPLAKEMHGGTGQHIASFEVPYVPSTTNKAGSAFSHVVSPDNGAYYAELWHSGGNWYAATGAGIHEITGVKKGMSVYDVMPRFMAALNKAACVPCAQARS